MIRSTPAALLVIGIVLLASSSCSMGQEKTLYLIGFGEHAENGDVTLLDYKLGNFTAASIRPRGQPVGQRDFTYAIDPPPHELYVKWRVRSTGKEYSDTVNLQPLLPQRIEGQMIYFVPRGDQLYVYLVMTSSLLHTPDQPDCTAVAYKDRKCMLLYPTHWQNF